MFVKGVGIIGIIVVIGLFFWFSSAPVGSTITINGHSWQVALADEPKEQEQGLSGRTGLAADRGMLFIFPDSAQYGFWMKDMKFPLDIVWIKDNQVVGISEKLAPETYPSLFYPPAPVDKVLEINAGQVEKFNIKIGDVVKFKM